MYPARLPRDVRSADRDHLGGEALHDQRAAAAAVLPEQRAGAQAGRGDCRPRQVRRRRQRRSVKKAFELVYQRDADRRGAGSVGPVRRQAGVSEPAAGEPASDADVKKRARREEQGGQGRREAAAGLAAPIVLLGAAQLERVPVHRLTETRRTCPAITSSSPSRAARRSRSLGAGLRPRRAVATC